MSEPNAQHLQRLLNSTDILAGQSPQQALNATCQAVVGLLNVSHCGFMLFDAKLETGQVYAEYPELGEVGRVIPLRSLLAGERFIAVPEPVVIKDTLTDPSITAVREIFLQHDIRSALIVPVLSQDRLLGSIGLDSIGQSRAFSTDEIELCRALADQVAAALEKAWLIEKTKFKAVPVENGDKPDSLKSLHKNLATFIGNSLTGIIAINEHGIVTVFNRQAEEMMGYRADEALGIHVSNLYADPDEPFKIGRLLKQNAGRLPVHDTYVKHKNGRHIPIRLTAISLYDARAQRIGSAGYFDRSIKELSDRQDLLLQTLDLVAREHGLQSLSERLISLLQHSFCRILLLDESEKSLRVEAAYLNPFLYPLNDWQNWKWEPITISEWPGLLQALESDELKALQWGKEQFRSNLRRLSDSMGFRQPIQSLLVIPLRREQRIVGLLEIGELRPAEQFGFTPDEKSLVTNIAAQITVLIDWSRLANRYKEKLERLHQAAQEMAGAMELARVEQIIVERARDILQADVTLLRRFNYEPDKLASPQYPVAAGISQADLQQFTEDLPDPGDTTRAIIQEGWFGITDLTIPGNKRLNPIRLDWLKQLRIVGFEGIPLIVGPEPLGVLYAGYRQAHPFTDEHRRLSDSLAAYAALSLKKAKLYDQVVRAKDAAEAVVRAATQGGRDKFLAAIAEEVKVSLACDAVMLYAYNPITRKLDYPPAAVGLLHPNKVTGGGHASQIVYDCLKNEKPIPIPDVPANRLFGLTPFAARENIKSLVVFPLKAAGRSVGVMFVNYRSPHLFTEEEIANIHIVANQAATSIFDTQYYEKTQRHAGVLEALHEAGQVITSSLQPEETLQIITQQALQIFRGTSQCQQCFSHIVKLENKQLRFVAASPDGMLDEMRNEVGSVSLDQSGSSIGITGRAARTGEVQNIGDVQNDPGALNPRPYINSQLSAPLLVNGLPIGVLTIEHPLRDAFSDEDERHAQSLAAQAAIAIQNAERHALINRHYEDLEQLREATQALTDTLELEEVRQVVVEQAKRLLHADFVVLWLLDRGRDRFSAESLVAAGVSADLQEWIKADQPQPGRTTYTILEKGWLAESDLASSISPELSEETRVRLLEYGIMSFQGIALCADNEALGVLHVNYHAPRDFSQDDQRLLENFAAFAALSLKKARLLGQLRDEQSTARKVAELTALGKEDLLRHIVEETQKRINCDAVILYSYNRSTGRLDPEPFSSGVREPNVARLSSGERKNKIVYETLDRKELYVVEDISKDPLFQHSRFAFDELIRSCVACPLIGPVGTVGVMFFNYRSLYRFTEEETEGIKLFANQAAVAVYNAQLLFQAQKRADALNVLFEAGMKVTSSLSLKDTLTMIAQQALQIVGACQDKGCFSHLGVVENDDSLNFIAASSEEVRRLLEMRDARRRLEEARQVLEMRLASRRLDESEGTDQRPSERLLIATRAVLRKEPENVGRVKEDPDYYPLKDEINSQLSVPIILDDEKKLGKVVGVLSIEHPDFEAFSDEDKQNVMSLAAQAAIAIQNARQFEALQSARGLAWMGISSTTQRHTIAGHANSLSIEAKLLEDDLTRLQIDDQTLRRVRLIQQLAQQIQRVPSPPSLTDPEGLSLIQLDDFLTQQAENWRNYSYYSSVSLDLDLRLPTEAKTFASREWLEQALDVLLDNGMAATAGRPERRVTIASQKVGDMAEISVTDNGFGIPPEIRDRILHKPIGGAKGLGMGLLIARTIIEIYNGRLHCARTDSDGTTMTISLPLH